MSDAAPPAPTPAKAQKKKPTKAKKPADHPKYSVMIKDAIKALKERGGSSRQAILKYIMKNFNVGKEEKVVNQHLKMALRAGGKNGSLKQAKGTGASGSFRIGETKKAADKPKKAKKPKAAKPKKAKTPKKAKKTKTAGEKKAAKPKKAKSPKKAAAKPKKAAAKPKKAAAKPKKAAAKPKKAAAKAKKA